MRILASIAPPEVAVLPVAMPVPGSTPLGFAERKFYLREHTPEGLCDYFASKQESRARALLAFASLPPDERTREASLRVWGEMHAPVVLSLLQEPADGLEPASQAEVALLTHTARAQILEAQEQLSGLEEALGNALDLVSQAIALEDQVSP